MGNWDREVDLLVFGSGAAGMTAALVGAHEGLEVLLCEKLAQIGGTTATSAGTLWIPGNNQSARAGIPDSIDAGRTYLEREVGSYARRDLLDAFLESGPKAVDYLEARTEVKFDATRGHPDYHPDAPGGAYSGRALSPKPFDGRLLGPDFALIRAPRSTLMILGGMMVGRREIPDLLRPFSSFAAFSYVTSILLRHACDRLRYPRGTRLILGNALVARFLVSLRKKNVPIETNAALVELVREGRRVEGAVVNVNGSLQRIRARRAVVLATGGFPGSAAWRAKLMSEYPEVRSYAFEESKGDALAAALAVGAALDDEVMSPAWWTPVSILRRPDGSELLWAHHSLDRAKPGLIAVNSAGKRFVNEGDSYHDFVLGMFRAHRDVPSIPAYLICDRRFLRKYGLGLIRPLYQRLGPYIKAGYLIKADSIPELARRIGVDPEGLMATVRENNGFAETGVDEAFGRGSNGLNRHNGDPNHKPNPCLGPIERPPFFAVAVYPGIIGTCIGLKADADARVIGTDGFPIEGLYVCGNDMATVMRGAYPGPGITLGPAVTFAYRAIMHITRSQPVSASQVS